MATNIARLNVTITGEGRGLRVDLQQNVRALRTFNNQIGVTSRQLRVFARSFVAGLGFAGVARGLTQLTRAGIDFNRTFTTAVRIQELNEEQLNRLRTASLNTSAQFLSSAEDLNRVLFDLGSAGFTLEQQIVGLRDVAEFAQAGGFADTAAAGNILINAAGAFGIAAGDVRELSDALITANRVGRGSLQQLAEGFLRVAPTAAAFGVSVDDTLVFLNALAQQGRFGTQAATELERVFIRLGKAAIDNRDAFKDAGIEIFDLSGGYVDAAQFASEFRDALEGAKAEQALVKLGALGLDAELAKTVLTIIGAKDGMDDWAEALENADGATRRIAANAITPLDEQLQQLSAQAVRTGDAFNRLFTPVFTLALEGAEFGLSALLGDFSALQRGVPEIGGLPNQIVFGEPPTETQVNDFVKPIDEALVKSAEKFTEGLLSPAVRLANEIRQIERFGDLIRPDIRAAGLDRATKRFVDAEVKILDLNAEAIRAQQSFVRGTQRGSIGDLANRIAGLDAAIGQARVAPEDQERNRLLVQANAILQGILDDAKEDEDVNLTVKTARLP